MSNTISALIDTCVILDTLQRRQPFSHFSDQIFLLSANRKFNCFTTAKAITDIYYITQKSTRDKVATREIINKLLLFFEPLDTSGMDIRKALHSQITDFEDAVMESTAIREKLDCIVTRNTKDFFNAGIKVYTPEEFVLFFSE